MTLTLDVKRALKSNRNPKSPREDVASQFTDHNNIDKARHILGLDTTNLPVRNHSTSSASTKLRGIAFSDATTAAISAGSFTEGSYDGSQPSELGRKSSRLLVKRNRPIEGDNNSLKPQNSSRSLRSFYDKNRLPLSVSQQTSDSSSRDFALRRNTPSIITVSSQEMEHTKQLRFFSRSHKKPQKDKSRLAPLDARPETTSSQISPGSASDNKSDGKASETSPPSISRISVTRGSTRGESPASRKYLVGSERPSTSLQSSVDPARAKINVRRPKVGTRDWFDDLDSDSSEGEEQETEPALKTDFAVQVEAAFEAGRIDRLPPRSSSRGLRTPTPPTSAPSPSHPLRSNPVQQSEEQVQQLLDLADHLDPTSTSKKRKISAFANADLTQQSILSLSSSDDDSDEEALSASASYADLARREIRASLMNAPWNDTNIELGKAMTVDTKESKHALPPKQHERTEKPPIPRRSTSRPPAITYLEDTSTDTLTQPQPQSQPSLSRQRSQDLITSFPRTPSEPPSSHASIRESVLSTDDDRSVISTTLMTVTRQEENLIAAMRLKKIAMRRAQANANRKGALKVLEVNSNVHDTRKAHSAVPFSSAAFRTSRYEPSRNPRFSMQLTRPDSVTTFQTDTSQEPSGRSSVATYLSEGSEDLQPSYGSIDAGTADPDFHRSLTTSRRSPIKRETFLSEMSVDTTRDNTRDSTATDTSGMYSETTASPRTEQQSQWSPRSSTRDSHVVVLDQLDRQMLREEIPSQLFMERPFIGWEARANMTAAH